MHIKKRDLIMAYSHYNAELTKKINILYIEPLNTTILKQIKI